MARLPKPGGDDGTWGGILNDYLSQSIAPDGTLKTNSVTASQLAPGSVQGTTIANNTITTAKLVDGAVTESKIDPAFITTLASPVTSVNAKTGVVVLDKTDIGLTNIDNTSDANKPISSATQTALDGKAVTVHTHTAANISDSTAVGRSVMTATDAAAARTAIGVGTGGSGEVTSVNTKTGDVVLDKTDIGLTNIDNTSDANKPISSATQTALDGKAATAHAHTAANISDSTAVGQSLMTAVDAAAGRAVLGVGTGGGDVTSVNTKTGVVVLDKTDIGLTNIDNTSDANKPISSATQTALDGKAVTVHTHTAANISDSTAVGRSLVTAADAAAARTAIGAGSSSLIIGTTTGTAKEGDYQPTAANISDSTAVGRSLVTAADAAAARTAIGVGTGGVTSVNTKTGVVVLDKTDIGLTNIDNTSDANKPISSATQTALDGKAVTVHTHTTANISDSTAVGRSLVTAADAAAARTAIGVDALSISLEHYTLTAAIAQIATNGGGEIFVPVGTYAMTADATIPSNCSLKFIPGSLISTTGYTLTISGEIDAGLQQVFTGSGTVTGTCLNHIIEKEWYPSSIYTGTLTCVGNPINAVNFAASPYTVIYAPEKLINCDCTNGAITINLFTATKPFTRIIIRKTDTTTNNITVDAYGAETINDALTLVISGQYSAATLVSDGANWIIA